VATRTAGAAAAAAGILSPAKGAGWRCVDPITSPKTPVNSAVVKNACM
jgi:hypothetical protein